MTKRQAFFAICRGIVGMVALIGIVNVLLIPALLQLAARWLDRKVDRFDAWVTDTRYGRWIDRRIDRIEDWVHR